MGIDLEDGTPLADKEVGRTTAVEGARALREESPRLRIFIRTNDPSSIFFAEDVEAAATAPIVGLMIPKIELADDVRAIVARLVELEKALERPRLALLLGVETVAGVFRAAELLAAS